MTTPLSHIRTLPVIWFAVLVACSRTALPGAALDAAHHLLVARPSGGGNVSLELLSISGRREIKRRDVAPGFIKRGVFVSGAEFVFVGQASEESSGATKDANVFRTVLGVDSEDIHPFPPSPELPALIAFPAHVGITGSFTSQTRKLAALLTFPQTDVVLLDFRRGVLRVHRTPGRRLQGLAFSPDGSHLAAYADVRVRKVDKAAMPFRVLLGRVSDSLDIVWQDLYQGVGGGRPSGVHPPLKWTSETVLRYSKDGLPFADFWRFADITTQETVHAGFRFKEELSADGKTKLSIRGDRGGKREVQVTDSSRPGAATARIPLRGDAQGFSLHPLGDAVVCSKGGGLIVCFPFEPDVPDVVVPMGSREFDYYWMPMPPHTEINDGTGATPHELPDTQQN